MTRNDLYAAAFRYKKAGLWRNLWDTEIFAIQLANGEYGYVSIMGHAGDFCALGLYIGDEGFDSFRVIASTDLYGLDEFQSHDIALQQNCLQLALGNKDDLMPDEVDETRAYAKANGIRLSGKNAFPEFIKYETGYHPWKVQETEDIDALYQAVEICTLLGEQLKTESPLDYGILALHPSTTHVPLLTIKDGCLDWDGYAPLPPKKEQIHAPVHFRNDFGAARVKKLPKRNTWDAEAIRTLNPIQETPDSTPYYPLLLLVVESKEGFVLPNMILSRNERDMADMLNQLAQAFIEQEFAPRELRCKDSRTYALLEDFCEQTGIRLRLYSGKMAMLDETKYALLDHLAGTNISDELAQTAEKLLSLPDDAIQTLPESILDHLEDILDANILPGELTEQLRRKLR